MQTRRLQTNVKMRISDLIIKKRDGKELTDDEIQFFIKELVEERLEGSQLGRLCTVSVPFQFIKHLISKSLLNTK